MSDSRPLPEPPEDSPAPHEDASALPLEEASDLAPEKTSNRAPDDAVPTDGVPASDGVPAADEDALELPAAEASAPAADPSAESSYRELPFRSEPPAGLRRRDRSGRELIDAMAGRASAFGFGFGPLLEAIRSAADFELGDAAGLGDAGPAGQPLLADAAANPEVLEPAQSLCQALRLLLGDDPPVSVGSVRVCASADQAVEQLLQLARTGHRGERKRIVTLVGSDHGRTGMCLTASGRPELHRGFGPMMAGFRHVPPEDIEALRSAVDDQTACVLLSPIDLYHGARPLDADYLTAVRQWCDEQGAWLIFDETRLCFGSSGQPLAFSRLAEVRADAVALSGGLFGGLPGGLVVATEACGAASTPPERYPLQSRLAATTLEHLQAESLPEASIELARDFAVELAERIGGLDSVRDLNASGMTIGVVTDLAADGLVSAAARQGLRIESAGDNAVRLQPPLVLDSEDRRALIDRFGDAIELAQRETAGLSAT